MTLRAFARMARVNPSSVSKAVGRGRLVRGADGGFDPEDPANREFLRAKWARLIVLQLQANMPLPAWSCLAADRAGRHAAELYDRPLRQI